MKTGWNDDAVPYFRRCASSEELFHQVKDVAAFDLAVETISNGLAPDIEPSKLRLVGPASAQQ